MLQLQKKKIYNAYLPQKAKISSITYNSDVDNIKNIDQEKE